MLELEILKICLKKLHLIVQDLKMFNYQFIFISIVINVSII